MQRSDGILIKHADDLFCIEYLSIHFELQSVSLCSKSPKSSDLHAHNEQFTPLWKILTIANGNANATLP